MLMLIQSTKSPLKWINEGGNIHCWCLRMLQLSVLGVFTQHHKYPRQVQRAFYRSATGGNHLWELKDEGLTVRVFHLVCY